jgi:dCTP deaminase
LAVLTGHEIERFMKESRKKKRIVIEPWPAHIGPNSVDLHLGTEMLVYSQPKLQIVSPMSGGVIPVLDPNDLPDLLPMPVTESGEWILEPGYLYLGHTAEYTETRGLVPYLDGRSSTGRLGVAGHVTAGRGDDEFMGQWTTEMFVIGPWAVALKPGMRLFQVTYHTIKGKRKKYNGRYQHSRGTIPSRYGANHNNKV